jgi:two-component system response regulator PilR (NtrC family)
MSKVIKVEDIVGQSKAMKKVAELILKLTDTKTSVLVTGESGTGKELVARAIHYSGKFASRPFVAVNCGAIPENLIESELFGHKKGSFTGAVQDKEGLFKTANGGTLFLDEIGELPLGMQVKLLRVLQERVIRPVGSNENIPIDVRIVAATNRDLEGEIAKGKFREDLYYRLNVINIKLPPLRERKEDLPHLIEHFLEKHSKNMNRKKPTIEDKAMQALLVYQYPGNIRELENLIERMIAFCGDDNVIDYSLIPQNVKIEYENSLKNKKDLNQNTLKKEEVNFSLLFKKAAESLDYGNVNLDEIVNMLEKEFVLKALEKANGVKKQAAQILGITFRSMRYRIEKLGIEDKEGDVAE